MSDLISVCVISYNSESTIKETLDSILCQSFGSKNIELIISDDCSKDNTLRVINDWSAIYSDKFFKIIIITSDDNVGISGNCNKAWRAATSKWIKSIAGDDLLLKDCLLDNINYCKENVNITCLFSFMDCFSDHTILVNRLPTVDKIPFFNLSPLEQFNFLSVDSFNFAPTSFLKKDILESVNYCDEKYRLIEDLPLWLRITAKGNKLDFLDKSTVKYRIGNSLSNSSDRLVNLQFIDQIETLHKELIWPKLSFKNKWRKLDKMIDFFSWRITAKIFKNKKNTYSVFFRYLIILFRPSTYIVIKNKFFKKYTGK
ncbi:glycosyltransferase family 2 protein [Photobacterium phosphoreum]|uniref:glycosyltransferase family 2 protein n=1 Tax=Photobacterium phosphoreum TaxID=659 RepID=UPI0024B8E37E|nr:glycosyltransferase family 2 protein [Photobacterium phosphoreum]